MNWIRRFFDRPGQPDMASGPVGGTLLALAGPLMASLLFQNLYAFINTVFVSWLGNVPLAAISLAVPLYYLALSLGKGIAMGSVVLISHARGSGDTARAGAIATAIWPLMLLTMLIFFPLLSPEICKSFFGLFSPEQAVVDNLYGFVFFLVISFPVMGFVMAGEALFMSRGNTVAPMKAMIMGNVLNISLDPIFIFYLELGTMGAAIATLLGQMAAGVYLFRQLKRGGYELPHRENFCRLYTEWRLIVGQGIFIALSYMIIPVGLMLLNGVLARFGAAAVGAWNMMSRLEMLVMLPVMGLSNALAAFISFNLGRREYGRIREAVKVFFIISLAIVAPVMCCFMLFPRDLVGIFRPTAEVVHLGGYAVRASGVAGLFIVVNFALIGVAQGLKRPGFMVVSSLVNGIGIRVPVALFLALRWGETGVFWSHAVAAAGTALLAFFFIRRLLADGELPGA